MIKINYRSFFFSVIGTEYNELMTANPYHTYDPTRTPYGFQPSKSRNFFV